MILSTGIHPVIQSLINWLSDLNNFRLLQYRSFNDFETLTQDLRHRNCGRLDGHRSSDHNNVAPDFVAESDAVACLHSEVSIVLAFIGWSGKLYSPNIIFARLYLISYLNWFELHVIATSLNQMQVLRPSMLAVVSKGPLLNEAFSSLDLVFVTKAFLDETTLISDLLLVFPLFISS